MLTSELCMLALYTAVLSGAPSPRSRPCLSITSILPGTHDDRHGLPFGGQENAWELGCLRSTYLVLPVLVFLVFSPPSPSSLSVRTRSQALGAGSFHLPQRMISAEVPPLLAS